MYKFCFIQQITLTSTMIVPPNINLKRFNLYLLANSCDFFLTQII